MVSVIIPTYNRADKIKPAVESVLNQTYTDFELIVVDDGSTDNTSEVIESIEDSRIRYVHQENAGACAARNNGINYAKGEYIAFHDSDDIWHKDKLEKQMNALLQNNADIVCCRLNKKYSDGTVKLKPEKIKQGIMKPVTNLFGIGTQTIVAKKEVFDSYKFDKDFPCFQECELLYRITKQYSLYCLDEGLVDYFVGADSISSDHTKKYTACKLFLQKHPEVIKAYPEMAKRMSDNLFSAAVYAKRTGNKDVRKITRLALKCNKNPKTVLKAFALTTGLYSVKHK